jgi:hypothetical protein
MLTLEVDIETVCLVGKEKEIFPNCYNQIIETIGLLEKLKETFPDHVISVLRMRLCFEDDGWCLARF